MMDEHMYDLGTEILDDGTIRLEQEAGSLEGAVIIDLHPCQLRHIAERAGLLPPSPTFRWPRGFVRRVERLHLRIADLVDFLASIPSFPPQSEMDEDEKRARDVLDAFDDLLTDFGILTDDAGKPIPEPLEAPSMPGCLPSAGAANGGPSAPSLFD